MESNLNKGLSINLNFISINKTLFRLRFVATVGSPNLFHLESTHVSIGIRSPRSLFCNSFFSVSFTETNGIHKIISLIIDNNNNDPNYEKYLKITLSFKNTLRKIYSLVYLLESQIYIGCLQQVVCWPRSMCTKFYKPTSTNYAKYSPTVC